MEASKAARIERRWPQVRQLAAAVIDALRRIPLPIWLLMLCVGLGLIHYATLEDFVARFNGGFGRAAGDFVLIILPAFIIANALSVSMVRANEQFGILLSPALGAGMICPDTAYATLSPFTHRRKQMLAYGAYAGFKLLYPAGPLIIATGMGLGFNVRLLLLGVVIFLPVWGAGILWAWRTEALPPSPQLNATGTSSFIANQGQHRRPVFVCFGLLLGMILIGLTWEPSAALVQYLVSAKGALAVAALAALFFAVRQSDQLQALGEIMQKSIRQTANLIFVIGLAAALGGVLSDIFQFDRLVYSGSSILLLLLAGFATAALFKVIQGSSMATFAAVAPIAGYLVGNLSAIEGALVVYAVCVGSMIAILPNDSFYWLVQSSVSENKGSQTTLLRNLAIGSTLQALVGLTVVLAIYAATVAGA